MEKFPEATSPKEVQTAEDIKETIVDKNEKVFADHIFQEILDSINEGWESLSETKRKSVMAALDELVTSLDNYHDSYIGLKFAASPERYAGRDIEKYKEAVQTADQREHILHNTFIDAVNILSRKMKQLGLSNQWRADHEIDGVNYEVTREKMKLWMFKIFEERMIDHV